MLTQIYGLTTTDDAVAVDRLEPDHVGVVLDEGIETWDSVDLQTAYEITRSIRNARIVALSLSTDPGRIAETAAVLDPAILHLARAHEMTPSALAAVRERLGPRELMLTVPVRDERALALAVRLEVLADYLLLDSSDPATGIVGATGIVHDWTLSARIVAGVSCPVLLAGGLGPENVVEAIRRVGPAGVDSETRTSCDDDRRRKDLEKVEVFIARARATRHSRRDGASSWSEGDHTGSSEPS